MSDNLVAYHVGTPPAETDEDIVAKKRAAIINDRKAQDDAKTIWGTCSEVEAIPGKCAGRWIFTNSRLPIYLLFDYLAGGYNIDDFCNTWDAERSQVVKLLAHMSQSLEQERRSLYAYNS